LSCRLSYGGGFFPQKFGQTLTASSLTRVIFKLEPPFMVGLGPTFAPPQQLAAANSVTAQDDDYGKQDPFKDFGRLHEFWQLPLLPS
jgi:hypothetical protein